MMNLFTVAFPTFNEENRIRTIIDNYRYVTDDIIVIDKYSTDKTVSICAEYKNVRVINYPNGIDEKQQFLIINDFAKYDWILYTTCSEYAPNNLLNELCKAVKCSEKNNYRAVVFNRISYTNGFITHRQDRYYANFNNGIYSRFINKNYFDISNSQIHFEIPVKAKPNEVYVIDKKIPLLHFRNDDLKSIEQKHSRYADIEAEVLFEKGKKASVIRLFTRTIYHFLLMYLDNYKNGFTGFIVTINHALYIFQVELRLLCYKHNYVKDEIVKNNKLIIEQINSSK